jgi:hypothetical protein
MTDAALISQRQPHETVVERPGIRYVSRKFWPVAAPPQQLG